MSTENDRYDPDNVSRIIVLVYGRMDHGGPFWCYVAVKPSMYEKFKAAEIGGDLDLYNFESFGEIIVSAEGETPPEDVTIKVAELYNTDPSTFFQPMDPQEIIAQRIAELKRRDEEGSN